jgi:hypothetical protein
MVYLARILSGCEISLGPDVGGYFEDSFRPEKNCLLTEERNKRLTRAGCHGRMAVARASSKTLKPEEINARPYRTMTLPLRSGRRSVQG